jgi:Major Facilitator Superfamily
MAAGRADLRGSMDEPRSMTTTTNNVDHATGRPPADGLVSERPALPGRWRALTVSLAAAFMTLLDVSIVNVALPSIERDLGASATSVQWVISGYALAFGLALVPAGRLGDTVGRRRMFLIALSAFVLTSALSGAAPTTGLLVAARLLQGVAGGMLLPQNSGLIQELFGGAERGRAFGFLGATVGLATAAGPVIGGLLLASFAGPDGWRWIFYVNLPIGLVALALAARLLPATARAGWRGLRLDLLGSLLLGGGVLCLLLPVVDASDGGLTRLRLLFGRALGDDRTLRPGRRGLPGAPRLRRRGPGRLDPFVHMDQMGEVDYAPGEPDGSSRSWGVWWPSKASRPPTTYPWPTSGSFSPTTTPGSCSATTLPTWPSCC